MSSKELTPDEKETFYDEEIAPVLAELGVKCREKGLNFLAICEWEPGEFGRSAFYKPDESGLGLLFADTAARANGNVDALIGALINYGKDHGHNSIFLTLLERQTLND